MARQQKNKQSWLFYGLLFMCSCLVITMVSKSSFLYYVNDWVDTNVYYTMGSGWLNGQIPYRDLFDHKGPMIYFLYLIATCLSPATSYLGLYLLEIISLFLTISLFFNMIKDYFSDYKALWFSFFFMVVLVVSPYFGTGGSVEELLSPCLFFLIYCIHKLSIRGSFTRKEYSLYGLVSGIAISCLFWSKFTLLGGWLGFLLLFLLFSICFRQWERIIYYIGGLLSSFLLISLIWVMYFKMNHALDDLIDVYFVFNTTVYRSTDLSITYQILQSLISFGQGFVKHTLVYILLFLGMFVFINNKQILPSIYDKSLYIGSFVSLGMGIYFRGHPFNYSLLPLLMYSSLILLCLGTNHLVVPKKKASQRIKTLVLGGLCVVILLGMNTTIAESKIYPGNKSIYLAYSDEDNDPTKSAQKEFAEIIRKEENPTVLNYGSLDMGLYRAADVQPISKYFMKPNVSVKDYPEIMGEQNRLVNEKKVEFVVVRLNANQSKEKAIPRNIQQNYRLVSKNSQYYVRPYTYYLYHRIDN